MNEYFTIVCFVERFFLSFRRQLCEKLLEKLYQLGTEVAIQVCPRMGRRILTSLENTE